MLMGRDGSIAKLDVAQSTVEVPVGEYLPYELAAVVKDPAGGKPWSFSLGRDFDWAGIAASRGYTVKAGSRVPVHPFAKLALDAKIGSGALSIPPRRGDRDRTPAGNGRPLDAPRLLSQRQNGLVRAASGGRDPPDHYERENPGFGGVRL